VKFRRLDANRQNGDVIPSRNERRRSDFPLVIALGIAPEAEASLYTQAPLLLLADLLSVLLYA